MTFLGYFLIQVAVVIAVAEGKTDKKDEKPVFQSTQIKVGNNHVQAISSGNGVGVASVASVASRNGRVSSYSGVYSHPGLKAPIMITSNDASGLIVKKNDGKGSSMTITKEIDDKYSKGTIKISPGSVSVTSISKSGAGPPPGFDAFKYQPTPFIPLNPFIHDPFFSHPMLPRFDPWFPNEMLKNTAQSKTNNVRPSWYYPSFNPFFNYWH